MLVFGQGISQWRKNINMEKDRSTDTKTDRKEKTKSGRREGRGKGGKIKAGTIEWNFRRPGIHIVHERNEQKETTIGR